MASMKERIERTTSLIAIAVRHGYGGLLARIGWAVPTGKGATVQQVTAEQLRDSLAEAGVTFIKLGQKLSSRPDLLPKDYVEALATLQENVPDPPVEELMGVLRARNSAVPWKRSSPISTANRWRRPRSAWSSGPGCLNRTAGWWR